MSLQHAAQHLAAQGRGPDTTLMHVTPGEVRSLNELAMAHGGQLTINPQTGLPEAGFLSSVLPILAGVALGPAGFGLFSSAMTAGLGVGAVTGLATGSLSKGLMAGLGAYGGAGLGQSLASSGMQAEASAAQAAQAAKTAPLAANAASAVPPPINYSAIGSPDLTSSVIAQPGNVAATPLGTPMTASGQAVSALTPTQNANYMVQGLKTLGTSDGLSSLASNAGGGMGLAKYGLAAAAPVVSAINNQEQPKPAEDKDMGQRYTYSPNKVEGPYTASPTGVEQRYFNPAYTPISADKAKGIYGFADGGVATATPMPGDSPSYQYDPMKQLFAKIESMPSDDEKKQQAQAQMQGGNVPAPPAGDPANAPTPGEAAASKAMMVPNIANFLMPTPLKALMAILGQPAIGSTSSGGMGLTGSPMGGIASRGNVGQVANAVTTANNAAAAGGRGGSGNVGTGGGSTASGQGTGIGGLGSSGGGLREGGLSEAYNLGGYSDGGRLLRGPGDGVSDSIPATIGHKQPARLADGEFVVPARIVSELGNGSTEAGARKLYAMMDRVQSARSKTVGKGKIAKNSRAEKHLPA